MEETVTNTTNITQVIIDTIIIIIELNPMENPAPNPGYANSALLRPVGCHKILARTCTLAPSRRMSVLQRFFQEKMQGLYLEMACS